MAHTGNITLPDTTSRQQKAAQSRQLIIATALTLFAKQGYAATSTRQLAQTAKVTEGLIFHYFKDKAAILVAIVEERHKTIMETIHPLKSYEGMELYPSLLRLGENLFGTLYENRDLTRLFISESQTNPHIATTLKTIIADIELYIIQLLRPFIENGPISSDYPLAVGVNSFIASAMMFFLLNSDSPLDQWRLMSHQYSADLIAAWFQSLQA